MTFILIFIFIILIIFQFIVIDKLDKKEIEVQNNYNELREVVLKIADTQIVVNDAMKEHAGNQVIISTEVISKVAELATSINNLQSFKSLN